MIRYEIDVKGMSCGHCVSRVEKALKPLGADVKVSLESSMATIESERQPEELLAALDEAGYPGSIRS